MKTEDSLESELKLMPKEKSKGISVLGKSNSDLKENPDEGTRSDEVRKNDKKREDLSNINLSINELRKLDTAKLYEMASEHGVNFTIGANKAQMIYELCCPIIKSGGKIHMSGILDIGRHNYGYLRGEDSNFEHRMDDIFVSPSLCRRFSLKCGMKIEVFLQMPRKADQHMGARDILKIEGVEPELWQNKQDFETLTATHPNQRLNLEYEGSPPSCRLLDLVAPLGKGQRALIAAPPRGGKTVLMKEVALALNENHPELELILLLLDERPEEVTDFKENLPKANIYASTFDELPERHTFLAELVLARARFLVAMGKDVVIMLDSLTRLARAYNLMQGSEKASLSGGLSKTALEKPRRFFSSARCADEGGSLTIVATALIETQNRADELIFEEFKGTGNMEVHIDQELANRRVFPAIHLAKTATRKDELIYHPKEFENILILRKFLAEAPAPEALEKLLKLIAKTKTNAELLLACSKL